MIQLNIIFYHKELNSDYLKPSFQTLFFKSTIVETVRLNFRDRTVVHLHIRKKSTFCTTLIPASINLHQNIVDILFQSL